MTLNTRLDFYRQIEEILLENDGLITPELEKLIEEIDINVQEKVDAYMAVLDRNKVDAEFFTQRAEKFYNVAKGKKLTIDRIKDRLKNLMLEHGKNELLGTEERFLLKPTKPRLLVDEKFVPQNFFMEVKTIEPDKELIRQALEAGHAVSGCELQPSYSITKYVRK